LEFLAIRGILMPPMGLLSRHACPAALAAFAVNAAPGQPLPVTLLDITPATGIDAQFQPPASVQISFMIAGAAAADVNNDGLNDLFILSGGHAPDRLYLCTGIDTNGVPQYEDHAAEWGIDRAQIGAGVSFADINNDGWPDLYITVQGDADGQSSGMHRLMLNHGTAEPGLAGFTDVADLAGVSTTSPTQPDGYGSAWGDINADGRLDLFVAGWILNSDANRLFLANTDGTFTDVTATHLPADIVSARGFSPAFADVNNDTHPDILLAADYGTSRLLLNDGAGRFTDATAAAGVGLDSNGMGSAVADFNADGHIDWYVTSIHRPSSATQDGNKLYLNNADATFTETARAAGVDDGGWGWGASAGDIDLDGNTDIIETNGWSGALWLNERSYLWLNNADGTFTESGFMAGLNHTGQGRGLLLFDADNDGDLDVGITAIDRPFRLYRNDAADRARNWVRINLDTRSSPSIPPMGVGTRIALTAGGRTQHRLVQANPSYLAQSPIEAHFGLNTTDTIERVEIRWPNGAVRTIENLAINTIHTLTPCDADTDGDHRVTAADVTGYIDAFLARERRADLDADARHTFFDIIRYLDAYHAGCPQDTQRSTQSPPPSKPARRTIRP